MIRTACPYNADAAHTEDAFVRVPAEGNKPLGVHALSSVASARPMALLSHARRKAPGNSQT